MFASYLLLFSLAISFANAYSPEAIADQILAGALPGAESLELNFNQFSGYLTVGGSKNMHYWLVESMNDPAKDPVTFWTNGGPGCSGLLGFFTEQGPFRPNADLTLSINPYAWNKISNMVFIESPCGVGFSYSDVESDYTTNDQQTAIDNYDLIQAFLQKFPEYNQNDLYITSESYGGHYMPTLAKQIVDQNTAGTNPKLNFKGFAVGNPFTDPFSGTPAGLATYWGHQIVAKPTWQSFQEQCVNVKVPRIQECEKLFLQLYNQIATLNPYALDYPICVSESAAKAGRAQRLKFLRHLLADASNELKAAMKLTEQYEPCASDYTIEYLNQKSVKAAIHVKEDIVWGECSYKIDYSTADSRESMVPIYQYLIDGGFGLDILVYSGDDDSVCATIGTQNWIWDMGYNISGRLWQPYTFAGQTAGFYTKWKNTKLGFVTVHGAGHEVPAYKPDVALDLFSQYLAGNWTNA